MKAMEHEAASLSAILAKWQRMRDITDITSRRSRLTFNCLLPFFPSDNSFCKACFDGNLSCTLPGKVRRFHKKIMKTFVLFFFSIKLIVIARRVKERMYAPGGIGFIAAQEDFDRVTKSQRIE